MGPGARYLWGISGDLRDLFRRSSRSDCRPLSIGVALYLTEVAPKGIGRIVGFGGDVGGDRRRLWPVGHICLAPWLRKGF